MAAEYVEAIERFYEAVGVAPPINCEELCRERCSGLEGLEYEQCYQDCYRRCTRLAELIQRERGVAPPICDICLPERLRYSLGFVLVGGRAALDHIIVPAVQELWVTCFCAPYGLVREEFREVTGYRFPSWSCYTLVEIARFMTYASMHYLHTELIARSEQLRRRREQLEQLVRLLENLREWARTSVQPGAPRRQVANIARTIIERIAELGITSGFGCLETIAREGGTRRDLLECLNRVIAEARRRLRRVSARLVEISEEGLVKYSELVSEAMALLTVTATVENLGEGYEGIRRAALRYLIQVLPALSCAARRICRRVVRRRGVVVRVIEVSGFACSEETQEVIRLMRRAIIDAVRALGIRLR